MHIHMCMYVCMYIYIYDLAGPGECARLGAAPVPQRKR